MVALRKESVDRNGMFRLILLVLVSSLSARRAWIEIPALQGVVSCPLSLSARRAWIEIGNSLDDILAGVRSLSARRAWIEIEDDGILSTGAPSRSPQGERG